MVNFKRGTMNMGYPSTGHLLAMLDMCVNFPSLDIDFYTQTCH